MNRPFAVFDIDGTLIRWQLFHAITDKLAKENLLDGAVYDELKAARLDWKRRSSPEAFKSYENRVVTAYEEAILHLSYEDFEKAATQVFDEYKDQVYSYTRGLIAQLKQQGYLLFAISGSQTEVVALIANHYGFDDFTGTSYEHQNGRFTGTSTVHPGRKHEILQEMVKKHGATYEGSIAVGDSEGDISMLEAVNQPIAFNPTRKLFAVARDNKWKMVIERKNVIYELEDRDGQYVLA